MYNNIISLINPSNRFSRQWINIFRSIVDETELTTLSTAKRRFEELVGLYNNPVEMTPTYKFRRGELGRIKSKIHQIVFGCDEEDFSRKSLNTIATSVNSSLHFVNHFRQRLTTLQDEMRKAREAASSHENTNNIIELSIHHWLARIEEARINSLGFENGVEIEDISLTVDTINRPNKKIFLVIKLYFNDIEFLVRRNTLSSENNPNQTFKIPFKNIDGSSKSLRMAIHIPIKISTSRDSNNVLNVDISNEIERNTSMQQLCTAFTPEGGYSSSRRTYDKYYPLFPFVQTNSHDRDSRENIIRTYNGTVCFGQYGDSIKNSINSLDFNALKFHLKSWSREYVIGSTHPYNSISNTHIGIRVNMPHWYRRTHDLNTDNCFKRVKSLAGFHGGSPNLFATTSGVRIETREELLQRYKNMAHICNGCLIKDNCASQQVFNEHAIQTFSLSENSHHESFIVSPALQELYPIEEDLMVDDRENVSSEPSEEPSSFYCDECDEEYDENHDEYNSHMAISYSLCLTHARDAFIECQGEGCERWSDIHEINYCEIGAEHQPPEGQEEGNYCTRCEDTTHILEQNSPDSPPENLTLDTLTPDQRATVDSMREWVRSRANSPLSTNPAPPRTVNTEAIDIIANAIEHAANEETEPEQRTAREVDEFGF